MTNRNPLEKQRDILGLFIQDTKQLDELTQEIARQHYKGLTNEQFQAQWKEYGLKVAEFNKKPGELAFGDQFVREKANLSSSEIKGYVDYLIANGSLVRNESGELEITAAGVVWYEKLDIALELEAVKSMEIIREFVARARPNKGRQRVEDSTQVSSGGQSMFAFVRK